MQQTKRNDTATWRRTKAGEWVVFGPASLVNAGPVAVSKRDGTVEAVAVASVGHEFDVDGVPHRYGYPARTHCRCERAPGQLWEECEVPGCDNEPVCLACFRCY